MVDPDDREGKFWGFGWMTFGGCCPDEADVADAAAFD